MTGPREAWPGRGARPDGPRPTTILHVQDGQATLVTPAAQMETPLGSLRAAARRLGARSPVVLVTNGEMAASDLPSGLPDPAVLGVLDGRHPEHLVVTSTADPRAPLSLHDRPTVNAAQQAARSAGLRLATLVPLAAAALRAADVTGPAVILHDTGSHLEITISGTERPQHRRAQRDPAQLNDQVRRATMPLTSAGHRPTVILIGPVAQHAGEVEAASRMTVVPLTLVEALRGASRAPTEALGGYERSLKAARPVDRPLLGALALAALINGGLVLAAGIEASRAAQFGARADSLESRAQAYRALKAANDRQQERNDQARALTGNKGPLAADLPLIAERVLTAEGDLQSLSGPNTPQGDTVRAYGRPVTRTYQVGATTRDPEQFIHEFTRGGLAADVREVACGAPNLCQITLSVAPVPPREAAATVTSASTAAPQGAP